MPSPKPEPPDRDADLSAIDALIDRLVPALTAKLAATHLGELEVREGDWRIRLRRPATAGWNGELRRTTDRSGRGVPVAEGHAPVVRSGLAPDPGHRSVSGSNGTGPGATHGAAAHPPRPPHEDDSRRVATSPAVGVFHPGSRATVGTRVRQGDTLGHVDVLGVREDVLAPADGLVGELLTEAGTAVEYGQELVVVALATPAEATR
ncbi:MAG TPA: biotin/lipoyl-containing protein [Candidatus Limnocylindrales bacterium]